MVRIIKRQIIASLENTLLKNQIEKVRYKNKLISHVFNIIISNYLVLYIINLQNLKKN